MRLFTTVLLLVFSFLLSAQTTYKCTYAGTMTVRMPTNMTFKLSGDAPDSIVKMFSAAMNKHLSVKPLVQLYERKISATADTTIIELENGDAIGGISMNPPYHKTVVSGGKILGVYNIDGNKKPLPEGRRHVLYRPVERKQF